MQENKQEKSPIKKRILQYLASKDISNYSCYNSTGITRGILTQKNGINEQNLTKFLAYYKDVSPAWLVLGEGEISRSAKPKEYAVETKEPPKVEDPVLEYDKILGHYFNLLREKDKEIGTLKEEIGRLKERLRQKESENTDKE